MDYFSIKKYLWNYFPLIYVTMSIGLRIKELRSAKKLTQSDLAASVGVDSSQFSKIEQGKLMPTIHQLMELSSKLDVSIDWLCFGRYSTTDRALLLSDSGSSYLNQSSIPLLTDENEMHFDALSSLDALEYFTIPVFGGADFLVAVKGLAMFPVYNNGDVLACKDLDLQDLFFQWGRVYVLKTSQGILIKRIQKSADDAYVLLVSENSSYDVVELHRKEILAIAIVVGVMKQV